MFTLSAGLDKPGKPGKLSHELLNKFVSDPVLTRPQSLPVGRLSAQSFLSSSEEIATSHENLNSKKAKVQIKVPDENEEHLSPSSADEDMLSDDDAGKETKKKKRKLRWKWSPFKKMKRLFRRKKSPTRAMSCEELPTECFKATNLSTNVEDDDSLRNRVKSEPALAEAKIKTPLAAIEVYERRNTADSPVYRTNSDPSSKVSNTTTQIHVATKVICSWRSQNVYQRFFSVTFMPFIFSCLNSPTFAPK